MNKHSFHIMQISITVFLVLFSTITLFVITNRNHYNATKQHYIAHAGGAIAGYTYTNSYEAVANSIEKGVNYIELDFVLTKDSNLVCAHDWNLFRTMCNYPINDTPLSLNEFSKCKLFGQFHPLTAKDVVYIMNQNPNVYLVTDKICDYRVLNKEFSNLKDRILVEVFSVDDYFTLKDKGYHPMYSGRYMYKDILESMREHHRVVNATTMNKDTYSNCTKDFFERLYYHIFNMSVAIFTAHNKAEADSIFAINDDIHFVYIDNVE